MATPTSERRVEGGGEAHRPADPVDLEPNQHRLTAILALVVAWWITEAIPIPMTALLGVALRRTTGSCCRS
jgi:di/tricarboxylate transporter